MLRWASLLWEEVQQLEAEGLQKIELAVAGSETEGLYMFLRGALSHSSAPPPLKKCHVLTVTISWPPPQESEGVKPEASAPVVELVLQTPSSTVSQALEVAIPAHMAPLSLMVVASKGCTNASLRGAVRGCQPHMLPSAHTCTETM